LKIAELMQIAAGHFPGDQEALADIFQAEVVCYAWRSFEKGMSSAECLGAICEELPPLTAEDAAGVLRLILREWKIFSLGKRGGGG
jgi:hypothetical protein